ncbi:MAG: hypothetical protein OEN23_10880 [Paracoccaceae bacterium]|nr:hypothetical protein [Paracoccaceae bacterium]
MTRAISVFFLSAMLAACANGDALLQDNSDKVWLNHRIPSK